MYTYFSLSKFGILTWWWKYILLWAKFFFVNSLFFYIYRRVVANNLIYLLRYKIISSSLFLILKIVGFYYRTIMDFFRNLGWINVLGNFWELRIDDGRLRTFLGRKLIKFFTKQFEIVPFSRLRNCSNILTDNRSISPEKK